MHSLIRLKRQIVVQFLVVLAPATVLNGYQVIVERSNGREIERTASLRTIADRANVQYSIYVNGVVDAVDSGQLSSHAVSALDDALAAERALTAADPGHSTDATLVPMQAMHDALTRDSSLKALVPFRTSVNAVGKQLAASLAGYQAAAAAAIATATAPRQQWAVPIAMLFSLTLAGYFIWRALRDLTGPLERAIDAADQMAAGNVQAVTRLDTRRDLGSLLATMRVMAERVDATVHKIRGASASLQGIACELAHGNQDLSDRTERQAADVEATAASVGQLTRTVRLNAQNAQQARNLALNASLIAQAGGEAVGRVVDTMNGISDSSRRVQEIIGVIDALAFQTNILALNAAVEAARAGEQGRGFAVVAAEVRTLAQRSAQAASEIRKLIVDSVGRVSDGASLAKGAGDQMREIVAAVQHVTDIIGTITTASEGQAVEIERVNQSVANIDQSTQQNAALVEQAAAAAGGLESQTRELVDSVNAFQVVGAT